MKMRSSLSCLIRCLFLSIVNALLLKLIHETERTSRLATLEKSKRKEKTAVVTVKDIITVHIN